MKNANVETLNTIICNAHGLANSAATSAKQGRGETARTEALVSIAQSLNVISTIMVQRLESDIQEAKWAALEDMGS